MNTNTQRVKKIPLAAVQRSIYYFELLHPSTDTYHHTIVCDLEGELNIPTMTQAVQLLMRRHETLQYRLVESDGQIYLTPPPDNASSSSAWPFQVFNLTGINTPPPPVEKMLSTLKTINRETFITQPFALNKEPLWRCALLQFANNRYQFVMVAHHIIVDVASKNILMKDLSEIYNSLIESRNANLPELPSLEALIPQSIDNDKLELWKKTLADLSPLYMKTDFMPQTGLNSRGDRVYFEIDSALIQRLSQLATAQNVSLHRIFLTSLYILLYRYTGQTDICIGTASANRRGYSANVDNIVSCFVNSIPVRLRLEGDMNFYEVLQKLSLSFVEALKNQLPFDVIARQAMGKKEKIKTSTASPFDIIFDLNELRTGLTLKNVNASYPSEINLGHSKFDYFGVNLDRSPNGGYRGFIEYNTQLFEEKTIIRIKDHLQAIWLSLAQNPQEKISDIFLLTPEECSTLTQVHQTDNDLDIEDHTIVDIFRQTAKHASKNTAVVFHKTTQENHRMSYGELHTNAETLASILRACGIRPDKRVGISVSRSLNLATAIWSVFKAGGVLLPLETTASELLDFKVSESKPMVIIVDNTTKDLALFKPNNGRITIINIDDWSQIKKQASKMGITSSPEKLQPDNLAYITYTSGSTGNPKGVMTTHRGLTNAAYAISDRNLRDKSKVLCTAKPNFDCFFFEMLEALMTNGELHLIFEEGRLSHSVLQEVMERHQINTVTLTPRVSNYLDFSRLPHLYDIVIMGDIANEETIKRLLALVQQRQGTNNPLFVRIEYGVQEASIFSTSNPNNLTRHKVIGRTPIRNTKFFIVDKKGSYECPIGVPGEIYIAGPSLARGYFNNQTLTDEKFITRLYDAQKHKFTAIPQTQASSATPSNSNDTASSSLKHAREESKKESHTAKKIKTSTSSSAPTSNSQTGLMRLYKTGDCAMRLPDGSIEFIGRIEGNRQVKIHDVRVELDSLETLLQRHDNIKDCLVIGDPKNQTLKGYLVLKNSSSPLSKKQANDFLRQFPLPPVARLSSLLIVDKFPINANGKIDVAALEKMTSSNNMEEDSASINASHSVLPMIQASLSPLEVQLKTIWEEVLGLQQTPIESLEESFEELGGDSATLAVLEVQMNNALPLLQKLQITDLSFTMTIRSLANKLLPNVITNTHLFRNPASFFDTPSTSSGNDSNASQTPSNPPQTSTPTNPFNWSLQ